MGAPRVSEILEATGLGADYSMVPRGTLEYARLRGEALHRAIEWHTSGTLDEASLHPDVAPGFDAYLQFVADTQHEALASELELVHPQWGYMGHPDRVGFLHRRVRALLDWKYVSSLDADAARLQVQAYRMLWNAAHPTEPVEQCLVVQFSTRGTYRLHDLTLPNVEQTFLAALVVYQERRRRGR